MKEILDLERQVNPKRNKTWIVIILTNTILISGLFLIFESAQGTGKLLIGGLGVISVLVINPSIALILL